MNKYVLIIIIAFIVVTGFQFVSISSLKNAISQKDQEIQASMKYIDNLKLRLLKDNKDQSNEGEKDHLKVILKDFLENEENTNYLNDKALSERIKRRSRFIPNYCPITSDYKISQRFSSKHKGMDLAGEIGLEVSASAAGEVLIVKYDEYFGNMLVLDHFNGYMTVYGHLAKILTEEEEFVKKGEIVGLVGNTGNSTGPHLHFEIIKDNKNIDPELMLIR